MKKIERLKSFHYTSAHPIIVDKINEIIDYLNMDFPEQVGFEGLWEEKNPSEFDKRLNALLKEFKSLPKEELIDSLEFYLKAIKHETPFNLIRLKEVAKPEVIKPTGVLGELLKTPPTQEELEEAEKELEEITEEEFKEIHMRRAFDIADALNGIDTDRGVVGEKGEEGDEVKQETFTRFEKGQNYVCERGCLCFTEGKTYHCDEDDFLTNDKGEKWHWVESEYPNHFFRLTTAEELNHLQSDQELTEFEDALVDAYMSNTSIIQRADELLSIAKKQFIDKACKWLEYNFNMPSDFEFHFRKAMEE